MDPSLVPASHTSMLLLLAERFERQFKLKVRPGSRGPGNMVTEMEMFNVSKQLVTKANPEHL